MQERFKERELRKREGDSVRKKEKEKRGDLNR